MLKRFFMGSMLMGLMIVKKSAIAATSDWQMNMFRGVTPVSRDMYDLHMAALMICAVIGIVVFGVMIFSLVHHRKSKGYEPAMFRDNIRMEIVWTIIPFLILIGLAIPATKVLIRMDDTSHADVTIKVVGYQWRWQYEYLDQGISFFSNLSTPYAQIHNQEAKGKWYLLEVDKPLVLPIHKKIRFLVTSNDVVHSWWVPELGIKRDAIPGFMHEAWARIDKPGTYRGQCTELCGINHGFMPIVVEAVSEEAFDAWVLAQEKTSNPIAPKVDEKKTMTRQELMSLGKKKYNEWCVACHQSNGQGIPPLYPALVNSSIAVGKPIARHIDLILNGIEGSAMQSYQDFLTDEEIAAIVTYERNAWENNTNDLIQPGEVSRLRMSQTKTPTIVKKARAGGFQ